MCECVSVCVYVIFKGKHSSRFVVVFDEVKCYFCLPGTSGREFFLPTCIYQHLGLIDFALPEGAKYDDYEGLCSLSI